MVNSAVCEPLRHDLEINGDAFTAEEKISKKIPAICTCRWALAIMGFLVFVSMYGLRVNLSVAIVCMVNHTATQHNIQESQLAQGLNVTKKSTAADENCWASRSGGNSTEEVSPTNEGELAWDKETQSLVLSSFFWGYVVTQIPAGWLAQRYGGKKVMGIFMFAAVSSSLLSSVGARISPYMLIVLRVINGLGQGALFPAMQALWIKWAPPLERSRLISFASAGTQIGNVIALPMSALLCDYGFDGGWSSIFYIFGTVGAVVLISFLFVVYDSPSQHPRISDQERRYIETSIGAKKTNKPLKTPWLQFFKSVPFIAIIVAQFCVLWGAFTLLTNIPTYMKEILKFNIKANGTLSAIPYILCWIFINIGAFLADYLRVKGFKTKNVRKFMMCIGSFPPGIALIITGFITCENPYVAVAILSVALAFSGFQFASVMVNHADIAPPFAAVLFGIGNSIGTLSGVFAPYAVGLLTPNGTQEEWRHVFYLSAGIYFFGAIFFTIFADGEIQPWVKPYMENSELEKTPLDFIFETSEKENEADGSLTNASLINGSLKDGKPS